MRNDRGMTLLELLVVMAIIAAVTGVAVGLIKRRDKGLLLESNARLVRASLRLARNAAINSGVGSLIRLDPEDLAVEAAIVEQAGVWHFEDDRGSRGMRVDGGTIEEGGKLGRCLEVTGGEVDLGSYPWFDAVYGFRLGFWIRLEELKGGSLASRGSVFHLSLGREGGLEAELGLGGAQPDRVRISTGPHLLAPGRWTHVALLYDGVAIRIEVDHVLRAERRESRPLVREPKAHLALGGAGDGITARMDEVRYDAILEGEREVFSVGIDVAEDSDLLVHLDGQGRLDPRFHRRPVRLVLMTDAVEEGADPETEVITVELSGAIR